MATKPSLFCKATYLYAFAVFLLAGNLQGQISFKAAPQLIEDTKSTITLMSNDMNNDQQDDLIVLENGSQIVIHINNALQRDWKKIMGPVVGYSWSGIVGDFNNDGKKEIVCGTQSSAFKIYTYDYIEESFSLYYQFDETFFIQNMNVVDLNEDGWLDLFLCNDDGENYMMMNDGAGNLSKEDVFDFSTDPVSDKSGNYGSVFVDFDLDGDQDLYIAKCRIGATSPEDPRRINQLFRNDGNGNFQEVASEYGIATGEQSWVADFADLDLDGDNDLIVANHYADLQVFENINNESFQEVQDLSGIELQNSFWQLSYVDMDNDGYLDIIITADDLYYYHNNGDLSFSAVDLVGTNPIIRDFSVTIGDYNNDGFYDLCTGYGSLNSTDFNHVDSVWLNVGNENDYIDLVLRGKESNRDAIGATIYCHQGTKTQLYQIKGGHSYGIMNSSKVHFGLGSEPLESIEIHWPNGYIQSFNNLEINRTHLIVENACDQVVVVPEIDNYSTCVGNPININFQDGTFQQWSDGSIENTINYTSDEIVYATYGIDDCVMDSWKICPSYLDTSTIIENYIIQEDLYKPCPGEEILIEIEGEEIEWSNGHTGSVYSSKIEEAFTVQYLNECATVIENYERENLSSDFDLTSSVIQYDLGDDVLVDVIAPSSEWYDQEIGGSPFYTGPSYTFENVQDDRTFYIVDRIITQYEGNVGLEEISSSASAPGTNVSPQVYFSVEQAMTLISIDVETSIVGEREIEILQTDFTKVYGELFQIEEGLTTLELNVELPAGQYILKTNEIVNQSSFGVNGPQFFRETSLDEFYPIQDEAGLVTITGNSFDLPKAYYAFYNWQIVADEKDCGSDFRHEVMLQKVVGVEETNTSYSFNNPVISELAITSDQELDIEILDIHGYPVLKKSIQVNERVLLSSLSSGTYLLKIEDHFYKLIKL